MYTDKIGVKPKRQHFFMVDNVVIDQYAAMIGVAAFAVYCTLDRWAINCPEAWLSVKTIGTLLGISADTVRRALKTLAQHHLITVESRSGEDGRQITNLYTITDLSVAEVDSLPPSKSGRGPLANQGGPPLANQGGGPSQTKEGNNTNTKKTTLKTTPATPNNGASGVIPAAPLFAEFYKAYPRKCARKDAERAWNRLSIEDRRLAFANLDRKKRCDPNWIPNRTGRTAIEYPATYLNGARWTDDFADIPRRKTMDEVLAEMAAEDLAAESLEAQQGEQHEEETDRTATGNDPEPGQEIASRNTWQVSRHLGQGQGNGNDRSKINR
jgi:hypothetical protein